MKKLIVVCSLVVICSLMVTSNIMAMPIIKVQGFVDTNAGTITKNAITTNFSKINYKFNFTDTEDGVELYYVNLLFEKDVFASLGGISDISHGWNENRDSVGGFFLQEVGFNIDGAFLGLPGTGQKIGVNNALMFSMNNVDVFNKALTDPLCPGLLCMWDEDQIWAQSWAAAGTNFDHIALPVSINGGSTSPTPEPGTFLLLGSGMAGVVFYVRRKKCLLNI